MAVLLALLVRKFVVTCLEKAVDNLKPKLDGIIRLVARLVLIRLTESIHKTRMLQGCQNHS